MTDINILDFDLLKVICSKYGDMYDNVGQTCGVK